MPNELLIILSFIVIYGGVILFYRFFGRKGLLAFNVMATILANIEVLILVRAFGVEMTLGNVLFGSTFLITDILSENHGRKDANRSVIISTLCSIFFILISQMWLLYTPSVNDWASGSFHLQQHAANSMRITCSISHFTAYRRMALPQMVGLVQKEIRGQQKRTLDKKQRIHNDIPAAQHSAVHLPGILRNLFF